MSTYISTHKTSYLYVYIMEKIHYYFKEYTNKTVVRLMVCQKSNINCSNVYM